MELNIIGMKLYEYGKRIGFLHQVGKEEFPRSSMKGL